MSCKHREKDNCKKDGRPCIHNSDCFEPIPITNADRIRAMSDEELADWFARITLACARDFGVVRCELDATFKKDALEWLKQPVPDDER